MQPLEDHAIMLSINPLTYDLFIYRAHFNHTEMTLYLNLFCLLQIPGVSLMDKVGLAKLVHGIHDSEIP